jgi:hypothetical protein
MLCLRPPFLRARAAVDRAFSDKSLKYSISNETVPPKVMRLYEELCGLANYEMDADALFRREPFHWDANSVLFCRTAGTGHYG